MMNARRGQVAWLGLGMLIGAVACDPPPSGDAASPSAKPATSSAASGAASSAKPVESAAPAATAVDQSKPENVVMAMFEAGKKDDDSQLASLCDDSVSTEKDIKMICASKKGEKGWDRFVEDAKTGTVTSTKIEGDTAQVDIVFGKESNLKETVELKKVGDKWFLAKM